jgi:mycobactin lysine-N-oxygenase
MATGADQLSFFHGLIDRQTEARLVERLGCSMISQEVIEPLVGRDLAVDGLAPKLHLPMLSGLRQGPGFANLSCLGRLSDRILGAYVSTKP